MNYTETNYYGNKKELKRYLEGVRSTALVNVNKKFKPKYTECEHRLINEYGFQEVIDKYEATFSQMRKDIFDLLQNLGEDISFSQAEVINNAYNNTDLESTFMRKIHWSMHPDYEKLSEQCAEERREISDAWKPVLDVIMAQNKKVKYLCKELEAIGFDLSDYYAQQAEKAEDIKPAPIINYNKLGI